MNLTIAKGLVRVVGLEPTRSIGSGDFKSPASTIPPHPHDVHKQLARSIATATVRQRYYVDEFVWPGDEAGC